MITIERTNDSVQLAALNREVQELHYSLLPDIFKPYDSREVQTAIHSFLQRDTCYAFIAFKDKTPAGYLICFLQVSEENAFKWQSKSLLIDQIGVVPDYRRQGIVSSLLAHAEKLALQLHISRVEIEHWTCNETAAAVFRKGGFLPCRKKMQKYI